MASSGATLRGVDALREVTPPFSPEQVVEQFSSLLRSCNCDKVVGDRYAGEWRFYNGKRRSVTLFRLIRPSRACFSTLRRRSSTTKCRFGRGSGLAIK